MKQEKPTAVFVVWRKRPNKNPFRMATFRGPMAADRFCTGSHWDCYWTEVKNPTSADLALLRD